jgi:hypothetical protein
MQLTINTNIEIPSHNNYTTQKLEYKNYAVQKAHYNTIFAILAFLETKIICNETVIHKIWAYNGSDCEENCLLGCDTI